MNTQTASTSLWTQTAPVTDPPALDQNVTCDTCIVGAGIAGLSVAYLLAKAGLKVVVLDDGPVASGQTHLTTAHLSNEIDDRFTEIVRIHGEEGARLAAQSHMTAIDLIEIICREENIDCDFERLDGYLFDPPEDPQRILAEEYKAAQRTGFVEVHWADRLPLAGFDSGRCLRFGRQGQFHPLKYLAGVSQAIRRLGGGIYCHTHAKRIQGGKPARVETEEGCAVTAQAVVVATNTPVNDMFAIHTKQYPYRTYVVGMRIPAGTVPHALYWDTLDPYHYVRVQRDEDPAYEILIVGGEDHKSGQADDTVDRYDRLAQWARERFSLAGEVVYRWTGQVMETLDGLAFIGRNPGDKENVYIATGDSGMGMTHGTIAGMLLSDLILGKQNPWAKLYDPSRKPLNTLVEFAKENLNVAAQYTSWVTPGEVEQELDIQKGCGAIMREGMHKVACYRDASGQLHKMTAVCPHLQCIVDWNDAAKVWDCPCHGSQFSPEGEVLNGPANVGLKRMES